VVMYTHHSQIKFFSSWFYVVIKKIINNDFNEKICFIYLPKHLSSSSSFLMPSLEPSFTGLKIFIFQLSNISENWFTKTFILIK